MQPEASTSASQFPCTDCGAQLAYKPGSNHLVCPYCGAENTIEQAATVVEEQDFHSVLAQLEAGGETYEVVTVKCSSCAAETTFSENVSGDLCAFCGTPLVDTHNTKRLIKPHALLPFRIEGDQARDMFHGWLGKLWFAPGDLKAYARQESRLVGLYIPHWTFDARTESDYTGQRGDHYYTTETVSVQRNGQTVMEQRRKQHTRWSPAWGHVTNHFDDVLVVASTSLPEQYRPVFPQDELAAVVPYTDAYLSGFTTESYVVDLAQGFEAAKSVMDATIRQSVHRDIGGDVQRISTLDTRYEDLTFKHVLLPLWISTYRYRGKPYRFVVNARTGAVQGERPWSAAKIALAVLAVILLIVMLVTFSGGS